jgi:hypothetical protein
MIQWPINMRKRNLQRLFTRIISAIVAPLKISSQRYLSLINKKIKAKKLISLKYITSFILVDG